MMLVAKGVPWSITCLISSRPLQKADQICPRHYEHVQQLFLPRTKAELPVSKEVLLNAHIEIKTIGGLTL